jgi:hypothetical protein
MYLCTPALIYFILSIFAIINMFFFNFEIITILINVICMLIWTWILNYLCSVGYSGVSWFLVLLPYIVMFLMVILAGSLLKKIVKSIKN